MDEFDKMEFNIDFNDLPGDDEELKKGLTKEEKEELEADSTDSLEGLAAVSDGTKLVEKVLSIAKDSSKLTLTKQEFVETFVHGPFYTKLLTTEQKKESAQFIEATNPANKKYFTRDEILTLIKNLLGVLTAK